MSGINLEKRVEKVGIVLAKRNIRKAPVVRVGLELDISGSAEGLYMQGHIQETVDRLMAVAMTFDDDGNLDMWTFSRQVTELETATVNNLDDYVNKYIVKSRNINDKWGGTSYAPPIKSAVDKYFPDSVGGGFLGKLFSSNTPTDNTPAMVMFVTDGRCNDESAAEKLLIGAQKKNIYWNMIGVGNPREFDFLERMADDLPNVGFVNMSSLSMTDEELYDQVISDEFCEWVKKF